jgi:predicted dehydrogenase
MESPYRVVVVGCGGISHNWFKAVRERPDVMVAGIVDLRQEAAEQKKAEYQLDAARTGTDLDAMLRATKPDIVFDLTVPEARSTVVRTALAAGCHVLSEKPMADGLENARGLIEAAARANRVFAVMQNRRFDPRIRALRAVLGSGALGEVTTVNADFYLGAHFGGFRDAMRHVLLLDMAIHSFDQARLLSGADPEAVYCHEWNPAGSWYAHGASAVAVFEMSRGIVCTYRGSWCAEGLNTSWECDWRIVGSKGTLSWDGGGLARAQVVDGSEGFIRSVKDLPLELPAATGASLHALCIHDFLDCLREGRTPETVCTENIKSLAMVFGAIESAKTRKRVEIQLP